MPTADPFERSNHRSRTPGAPGLAAAGAGAFAGAFAGAIAGTVAIAVGELLAGLLPGAPSLVVAIGDLVIDLQPPGAKEIAVELFGTNDKLALNVAVIVVAILIAAGVGVARRRRWAWAVAGVGVVATGLAIAVLREPLVDPGLALITVALAAGAGLGALRVLLATTGPAWARQPGVREPLRAAKRPGAANLERAAHEPPSPTPLPRNSMPDWDRRRFLIAGGSLAVGSLAIGALGRSLLVGRSAGPAAGSGRSTLPAGALPAPPLPAGASLDLPGITPIVVPNERFYRIDTALVVPPVNVATWTLTVRGLVEREVILTYDELTALPLFEQYVTIACVSNRVGENLVGNAKWTGAHLREVLAMAGVRPEATQIVGRSVDGFTVGFPTEWAMDPSRDPMIALGMNGVPLPPEHGYPARLIVPGLYGYVSATKWLSEIELTTLEAFDASWVPLGWAKEAPILTQSRIDLPRDGARLAAGPQMIGGVAWAPDRGVSKVEVKIDDGPWQTATLSAAISKATWVQWVLPWHTSAGSHRIEVRATDGTGEVQTDQVTPPSPDGARGHHHVKVQVG